MARILQFNIEDELGQYVPQITGKQLVEIAEKIHADTLVLFARDAWGRSYYSSKVSRKNSKLGGRDLIEEVVEEARKRGIKVYVMVGHTTHPELYRRHPDWAQRKRDGRVITMDTDPSALGDEPIRWPLMCLNSPFLEYVICEAKEVLEYGVDGVFLDSFRYMPDVEKACFCKYCRDSFRDEIGASLPEEADWDSLFYRKSFLWRYKVNVDSIKAIYNYIKSVNPEIPLVYNSHPAGWKGRANRVVELARDSIDIVFAECSEADYQPPGFIAEMVKLSLAASGGKEVWASRNSFHTCLTTASTSPVAARQGLREAFVAGGSPLYLVFSSAFVQDSMVWGSVSEVFEEIEKLEEYMDGARRLRYAGVVYSSRTRDWAGRDRPEHVTDCFRGFYYALTWAGLPVDYIVDWQLDEGFLEDYSILILANTQSLSRSAVIHLRGVEDKGIIATYLTSIMDDMGCLQEELQLSELLGVEYRGIVDTSWSYIYVSNKHGVTEDLVRRTILWGDFDREFIDRRVPPSIAWHTRVETKTGAKAVAWICEPSTKFGYEYENGRSPPLLGSVTKNPAIVVGEERKTVYYTGQLGRLYWRLGLPDYEKLILNSVLWAGGAPPIRVEADGLIQFEPYIRDGQIIVHLLNLTYDRRIIIRGNTALQRSWSSTVETVMPPRRIVPLNNVKIYLSKLFEPTRIYSPVSGRRFNVVEEGDTYTIGVGYLGEYELVVIDLR